MNNNQITENKKDLKFIVIFLLVVACCGLYVGIDTYAKYRRSTKANVQATVAKWNIKVNTEDIKGKEELSTVITPTIDANTHVKDNVIAPGSTGSFNIIIDATDVDVDFNYSIKSLTAENSLKDFKVKSYSINGGTETTITSDEITGSITKNTATTTINVKIEWDDNETTQTMNNQDDTTYAQDTSKTPNIKLQLTFTQKK